MENAANGDASAGQRQTEAAKAVIVADSARRALEEAEARRQAAKSVEAIETNGRGGLDPVRYGDWEVRGLATDF